MELYLQACEYERMLSLDLSCMTLDRIGNGAFCKLAADIARMIGIFEANGNKVYSGFSNLAEVP